MKTTVSLTKTEKNDYEHWPAGTLFTWTDKSSRNPWLGEVLVKVGDSKAFSLTLPGRVFSWDFGSNSVEKLPKGSQVILEQE